MNYKMKTGLAWALCSLPIFSITFTGCQQGESPTVEQSSDVDVLINKAETQGTPLRSDEIPKVTGERANIPNATELNRFLTEVHKEPSAPASNAMAPAESPAPLHKVAGYGCVVNFNSALYLSTLVDHASYSFAPYYQENCGLGNWAQVTPRFDGHFHLNYENPRFSHVYTVPSGKLGIYASLPTRTPPKCEWNSPAVTNTLADAANYSRYMMPHAQNEWMQFAVSTTRKVRKTFDLNSIYIRPIVDNGCNVGGGKLQLWVKKAATQQWSYWASLSPGYIWSPYTADGSGLDEIQFTAASGSIGWSVDDINIYVH